MDDINFLYLELSLYISLEKKTLEGMNALNSFLHMAAHTIHTNRYTNISTD